MSNQNSAPFPVIVFLLKNFLLSFRFSTRIKEFYITRERNADNIFEYDLCIYPSTTTVKDMLSKLNKMTNDFMLSSDTLIANLAIVPVKCSECKIEALNADNIKQVFDILEKTHQPSYLTNLDKILRFSGQIRQHLEVIEDASSNMVKIGEAAESVKTIAESIVKILTPTLPSVMLPLQGPVTAETCRRNYFPFSGVNLVYSVAEFRDAVHEEYLKRNTEAPAGVEVKKKDFYFLGDRTDEFGSIIYINPPASEVPKKAIKNLFKTTNVMTKPMSYRIYSDDGRLIFAKYIRTVDAKTVFKYLFTEIQNQP